MELNARPAEIIEPSSVFALHAMRFRLAAQLAPKRWRSALILLADDMDAGKPLNEAVAIRAPSMPEELSCLLREACSSKDPGKLILHALRMRSTIRRKWNQFLSMCIYPIILLVFALAIGIAFTFCMRAMISLDWIDEFGLQDTAQIRGSLTDQYHAVAGIGFVVAWLFVVLGTVYLVGPPWAWLSVVGGMIAIGKPLRWLALQELLMRLQIFIDQKPTASEAAQATARSFSASYQSVVAHRVASRLEQGVPIGRTLGDSMLSDGLCRPGLYLLDDRGSELPRALGQTTELLSRLTEQRLRTLGSVFPLVALGFVGSIVWASVSNYLLVLRPLISLISSLA